MKSRGTSGSRKNKHTSCWRAENCRLSNGAARTARPGTHKSALRQHIERLENEGAASQNNLAKPVATTIVRNEIARIASLIEKGPRSWPKEERADFWLLPGKLREQILERDRRASKTVRNAQNETAELRHKLKSFQQKELSNAKVSSE
jgi:hypothetical protein